MQNVIDYNFDSKAWFKIERYINSLSPLSLGLTLFLPPLSLSLFLSLSLSLPLLFCPFFPTLWFLVCLLVKDEWSIGLEKAGQCCGSGSLDFSSGTGCPTISENRYRIWILIPNFIWIRPSISDMIWILNRINNLTVSNNKKPASKQKTSFNFVTSVNANFANMDRSQEKSLKQKVDLRSSFFFRKTWIRIRLFRDSDQNNWIRKTGSTYSIKYVAIDFSVIM